MASRTSTTIGLNAALLFVMLFYVYPLKFMFGALIREITGLDRASPVP